MDEINAVVRLVAPNLTIEPETKFVPVTVRVKEPLPAATHVGLSELVVGPGLLIVNVAELEVPPPGAGLTTVTDAVPPVATFAAGTTAVSLIEDTNVVTNDEPFHLTVELDTKLVPLMVRVNWALPAAVEVGLIDVMVGTGLLIVRVSVALPVPPELVALIVTLLIPAVVGVPEITPVVVFTVKPAGSPVAL